MRQLLKDYPGFGMALFALATTIIGWLVLDKLDSIDAHATDAIIEIKSISKELGELRGNVRENKWYIDNYGERIKENEKSITTLEKKHK